MRSSCPSRSLVSESVDRRGHVLAEIGVLQPVRQVWLRRRRLQHDSPARQRVDAGGKIRRLLDASGSLPARQVIARQQQIVGDRNLREYAVSRMTCTRPARVVSRGPLPLMSLPPKRTLPPLRLSSPAMAHSGVVFTAPLDPSNATASPAPIVMSTPCSTRILS
jgi:hypothetical protein